MNLIQLPITGDWIDPATVTAIRVFEASEAPPSVRVRVVVVTGGTNGLYEHHYVMNCDDLDAATKLRDKLAGDVRWALESRAKDGAGADRAELIAALRSVQSAWRNQGGLGTIYEMNRAMSEAATTLAKVNTR